MANKPILFYAVEDLIASGVKDIGIIVGPNRSQVENAVKNRSWDAKIEFIPQDMPIGLAHTVMIAESFIVNEPFIVYLGDNLLCNGIADHARTFQNSGADASILLAEVDHLKRFGVAELNENGKVIRLVEKPKTPSFQTGPGRSLYLQPVIF